MNDTNVRDERSVAGPKKQCVLHIWDTEDNINELLFKDDMVVMTVMDKTGKRTKRTLGMISPADALALSIHLYRIAATAKKV